MTTNEVSVAEAKRYLSDLLGRVAYRGERITISKRGKPMAMLVPAEEGRSRKGIAQFRGWLDPSDPFFEVMDQIVADRQRHIPRVLKPTRS
jgi:prevent-host-death family protein